MKAPRALFHPAIIVTAVVAVVVLLELVMRSRYQLDVKSKVVDVRLSPVPSPAQPPEPQK